MRSQDIKPGTLYATKDSGVRSANKVLVLGTARPDGRFQAVTVRPGYLSQAYPDIINAEQVSDIAARAISGETQKHKFVTLAISSRQIISTWDEHLAEVHRAAETEAIARCTAEKRAAVAGRLAERAAKHGVEVRILAPSRATLSLTDLAAVLDQLDKITS